METIANIATDEGGVVTIPYLCSKGYLTWLIGRNIEARPITYSEWEKLRDTLASGDSFEDWALIVFKNDMNLYAKELYGHGVMLSRYSDNVKNIILNLAYNMGTSRFNPTKWPMFFAALGRKDWTEMAAQLKYTDHANSDKLSSWWTTVDNHDDNFVGRAERLYNSILEEIGND